MVLTSWKKIFWVGAISGLALKSSNFESWLWDWGRFFSKSQDFLLQKCHFCENFDEGTKSWPILIPILCSCTRVQIQNIWCLSQGFIARVYGSTLRVFLGTFQVNKPFLARNIWWRKVSIPIGYSRDPIRFLV